MYKKVRFKGLGYDFTEKRAFIGKLDVTQAFRDRENSIQCKIAMKEMIRFENEVHEKNQIVLLEIENLVDQKYLEGIKFYLEDCENTTNYAIEDEVPDIYKKYKQSEECFEFGYAYVCQTVGMAGDDYSGTVFLPLGNNKFLRFDYWM